MWWAVCSSKAGGPVDDTWTKKELGAECKRRGIKGCSHLDKAGLIDILNEGRVKTDAAAVPIGGTARKGSDARSSGRKSPSVAELREECRQRGLTNYGKLKKDDLVLLLKDDRKSKSTKKEKPQEPTLEELRAECRKRGMTGFGHLRKKDLIRRMEDYSVDSSSDRKKSIRSRVSRLAKKKVGGDRRARAKGPLRSRAQERFDAGPTPFDTPGFLYIYSEPDGAADEWKIGKTTLDPPERRMLQSASTNRKVYKLKASWYVPWCGYVEKIIHLDLDDLHIVPGKVKKTGQVKGGAAGAGGTEDGGTEWFRGDIRVIEARIKLAVRMVALREADEADELGVAPFCGMFRCGLPLARRREQPQRRTAQH